MDQILALSTIRAAVHWPGSCACLTQRPGSILVTMRETGDGDEK